jgi:hypothetical protein
MHDDPLPGVNVFRIMEHRSGPINGGRPVCDRISARVIAACRKNVF